jgi:hypothetical protein
MLKVSEHAVAARVNRALRKQGEALKRPRSGRGFQELGQYYIVDTDSNFIVSTHVDIVDLAREMNVMAPYETVAE